MSISEDETNIGLLQAGTPQFDDFSRKLKRNISQWISQIDAAIVIATQSRSDLYHRHYNDLKQDMVSCLSKCDRAWNFNSLSHYEFDAIRIKNEFHRHYSYFLYELRLSQNKKKLQKEKNQSSNKAKMNQHIDSSLLDEQQVCFSIYFYLYFHFVCSLPIQS